MSLRGYLMSQETDDLDPQDFSPEESTADEGTFEKIVSEGTDSQERRGKKGRRKAQRRLADHLPGEVRQYNDGRFVFREGERGDQAFIVKSGTVEIFKTFTEGGLDPRTAVLGELGEGSMFGEMALIDNEPRMASARAVGGELAVYVITRRKFESKLGETNLFIGKLLQILAANVRTSSEKVK